MGARPPSPALSDPEVRLLFSLGLRVIEAG
jgi:hypothetical protein